MILFFLIALSISARADALEEKKVKISEGVLKRFKPYICAQPDNEKNAAVKAQLHCGED